MEIKDFLSELEEQLTDLDEKDNEIAGQYIPFVERQGTIQTSAACNGEFMATSILKLFQILHKAEKDAAANLLILLCMQYLGGKEEQEGVEH